VKPSIAHVLIVRSLAFCIDSGVRTPGNMLPSIDEMRWTFILRDSILTLRSYVSRNVATGKFRSLRVTVDGDAVGTVALAREGVNELRLAVPAESIAPSGFKILKLDVDDRCRDGNQEYGVVLLEAGFEYGRRQ
jgi:hypothetical protein